MFDLDADINSNRKYEYRHKRLGGNMNILEQLRDKNKNRVIYSIDDGVFGMYGRKLEIIMDESIKEYMLNEAKFPKVGNTYVGSDKKLETFPLKNWVENNIYAGVPVQIGYCNGHISNINGFEFHQCSEVFVAITDCLLALISPHKPVGSVKPYNIDECHLFFIPEGTVLELYPLVGHFSPMRVHEEGYKTMIILTKGTNESLDLSVQEKKDERQEEDHSNQIESVNYNMELKQKPFAINKWLYVHSDRMDLVEKGAYLHVYGDNSAIKVL